MIDKVGSRIMLIITCVICVIGQTIYSVGGLSNIWAVMLLGRVIFGIGGEVLHAAQNTLMSNWFKASELSVIFALFFSWLSESASPSPKWAVLSTPSSPQPSHNTTAKHKKIHTGTLLGRCSLLLF
jgi:MFS family permease